MRLATGGHAQRFWVLPVSVRRWAPKARQRRRRTKHHILMWMHTIVPPPEVRAIAEIIPNFGEFFGERTLEYRPIGGGSARIGVNAEEEEGDHEVVGDGSRHPYSQKETLALYDAWISVSYDPFVGNQQTNKCF